MQAENPSAVHTVDEDDAPLTPGEAKTAAVVLGLLQTSVYILPGLALMAYAGFYGISAYKTLFAIGMGLNVVASYLCASRFQQNHQYVLDDQKQEIETKRLKSEVMQDQTLVNAFANVLKEAENFTDPTLSASDAFSYFHVLQIMKKAGEDARQAQPAAAQRILLDAVVSAKKLKR